MSRPIFTTRQLLSLLLSATALSCTSTPSAYLDGLERWRAEAPRRVTQAAAEDAEPGSPQAVERAEALEEPPRTLSEHLRLARLHSPALLAAAQEWRAALERVPQAVSLPDPRLSVGYFVEEVETRAGPMDWRVGVSQAFPWPGSLDAAGKESARQADAAREHFVAAGFKVAREVRDAWFETLYLNSAVAITRGHRDLLMAWEEVAQVRYATGEGRADDVLRAQVELGKLDDRVHTLEDLRLPVAARINAALDRPAHTPLPTLGRDWPAPPLLDESLARSELPQSSPWLAALDMERVAAQHALELADKQFYPDLSLGLEYTAISSARTPGVSGSGDDALAVTVGIGLPLRRARRNAGLRQGQARLAAATARLAAEHNRLAAELEMVLYRVRDAARRVDLYRDTLVPKGRESVESTTAAYQSGAAGFLELMDAERVLLEFQLAASRAQADRLQALAEVERLTGLSLFKESEK